MKLDDKDYSFVLAAGVKARYVAGPYNIQTGLPRYALEISAPPNVRDLVEVNQILCGSQDDCRLGWEIHNKSSWIVFVAVTRDGALVRYS
jgi:hypothetical protein